MIRKLILFFLLFLAFSAHAQDDDYGENFLDYVKNDLPRQSKEYASNDYKSRWFNYFQIRTDQRNYMLYLIDSVIREVQIATFNSELQYDSLIKIAPSLNDSLLLDMKRLEEARLALYRIHDLHFYLEQQQMIRDEMDSASSREAFLRLGLDHSGKEQVLRSIFDLGHNLQQYGNLRYGVYVQWNASGDSTWFTSEGYGYHAVSGILIDLASYYPQAAPYLYAAAAVIEIFYFYEREQQRKALQEGLKLIDKKVIGPEEMYKLSVEAYQEQFDLRESINLSGDTLADSLKKYLGLADEFVSQRFQVAATTLTQTKIKYLEDQYKVQDQVRKLFDQERIAQVGSFAAQEALAVHFSLSLDSLKDVKGNPDKIEKLEQAGYQISWLKKLIAEWNMDPRLIPLNSYLSQLDSLLEIDSIFIDTLMAQLPLREQEQFELANPPGPEMLIPAPVLTQAEATQSSEVAEPEFGTDYELGTLPEDQVVGEASNETPEPQDTELGVYPELPELPVLAENVTPSLPPLAYMGWNESTAKYALVSSDPQSFSNSLYNAGASPYVDVLASINDGGFFNQADNKDYGVHEIKTAKSKIDKRIDHMRKRTQEMTQWMEDWELKNTRAYYDRLVQLNKTYTAFDPAETPVPFQFQSIGSPSGSPVFSSEIGQLSRDLFPGKFNVPGIDVPDLPAPYRFFLADEYYRYQHYQEEVSRLQVRTRIMDNYRNGRVDQVFASWSDFGSYQQSFKNVSRYASMITDPRSQVCMERPLECAELSSHALNNMKLLRYYSLGWITEQTLNELTVLDRETYAEQIVEMLMEFGNMCHDADPSQNTPCNIYASLALKRVYGIDDFYFMKNGKRQYKNANQIHTQLSLGKNGWRPLGQANSQQALDDAAFYASMGKAVVAVSKGDPHGHVVLVMPSLANEVSGLPAWGDLYIPRVTSYFINRPEKTFYYKSMSFAWSSPNGVYLFVKDP